MADGTLFTYPDNFRAQKILIAAKYSGAKVTVPDFKLGQTNKTNDFLKKFPLGKVPAFEAKDGTCVFESNAIARFVGGEQLHGKNKVDAAHVEQWISFADSEIVPSSCTWVFPCLGIIQFNKQATEQAKEFVKKALQVLDNHLKTRSYLVGERISQADITVCCSLLHLYTHVLEPSFRGSYQNTNRWFTTLINQPEFKAVIGEVKLCTKMAQFDNKKYAEIHGGGDKGGKKKEAKKEAPKEKKPKAAEPEPEPPKQENKDPFAHLPKGNFDVDAFKREYSNNPCSVSLPYFWEKFDKENFSLWYCEYMYPEDLKLTFMTSNLVSGFFQRLDKMRKHAFGRVLILGENKESTISGVWFWRGQERAFDLSEDLRIDSESYKWKKLDPNNEEDRKLVNGYWEVEEETQFKGKKVADGPVFK